MTILSFFNERVWQRLWLMNCAFCMMSFMSERLDWADLEIFLHVADSGSLSAAGRRLGVSGPTVGRRMLALEQRAGQPLFHRAQTGYRLTAKGRALFDRVRLMQAAAVPVRREILSEGEAPLLRLSAGTATAQFLADRVALLQRPGDAFRLNFVTTEDVLDIAHRAVDLGIRNRPAEGGNLASRRLGTLRFAPYRSWSAGNPELLGWVALDPAHARHAAARWVHRQDLRISVMAGTVATVHDLVRAGAGIGLIPCMIGDADPALARAGAPVEELTEEQYLVMHDDDRHRPMQRRVIERIVRIYKDEADLLAGARPLRGGPPSA